LDAVAFDLDFTLITYPLSVAEVFAAAFDRAGIDPAVLGDLSNVEERYNALWEEHYRTQATTESLRLRIIRQLLAERGSNDPEPAARLSEAYGVVRSESGVCPLEGAVDLLGSLKSHYKLGLLTNGPTDMQWPKIDALGLAEAFDAIVVAGDVGIYKPDARVFGLLLDRLGVDPAAALYVGDNYEVDILGAHSAGMRTAWVRTDGARPTADVAPDVEVAAAAALREVLL
jgi:2-haloalkanoic acid dehalogenase type II